MGIGGTVMDSIGGMAMEVHTTSLLLLQDQSPQQHLALEHLGNS